LIKRTHCEGGRWITILAYQKVGTLSLEIDALFDEFSVAGREGSLLV